MDELFALLYVYVKGIWKYRWVAMILAWVIAIVGWVVVYKLPDNYEASARIYVDTQDLLRPLMAGMTVTPNAQQQISIISRTLISRPNVERIMRMVDLDIQVLKETDRGNLVTELMKDIRLGAAGGDNIFTISYNNKDPILAKDIVQALLTIFVEEGLEGKKEGSSSAIRFIDQQIAAYEKKLIVAEKSLADFKQKYIGLLPGQGSDYHTQLLNAGEELKRAELALREAEEARSAMKKQIRGDEPVFVLAPFSSEPEVIVNREIDARISTLKEDLDTLSLNFTEQHPDVVATKRLISVLEERKKEEAKLTTPNADPGRNYSPMLQQLNVALAETETIVASMQARVAEYASRYDKLKSMSNAIPEVESEFTQLNRDYAANKANYEKLLERRISARMSGELTSSSGLLSFRIIDPPTVPEIPSGPDRALLSTLIFLVSIGIGVVAAFIISQVRPAFHSLSNLREVSGFQVIGTVPMVWTIQEKIKQKRRLFAYGFSFFLLVVIYVLLIAYTGTSN